VTTPSAYVRGRVIELLGTEPDRVLVVGAPLFPNAPRPDEQAPGEIGRPFFIYPAITRPHKNHVTLLRAFARVASAHPEAVLVLTGAPGPAEGAIGAEIRRLGLGGRVLRLGRIPQDRLDRLLREAVALVYPSRFEGFGLPLVEAMALGCPVIASDATALPEVLGEAGSLVDPDDVEGWAGAMRSFLEDPGARGAAIAAGRARAAGLTPAETAARLVDVYRRAVGGP
jgi:alpha-1,3-rhamnosyl/mannosyltransferase